VPPVLLDLQFWLKRFSHITPSQKPYIDRLTVMQPLILAWCAQQCIWWSGSKVQPGQQLLPCVRAIMARSVGCCCPAVFHSDDLWFINMRSTWTVLCDVCVGPCWLRECLLRLRKSIDLRPMRSKQVSYTTPGLLSYLPCSFSSSTQATYERIVVLHHQIIYVVIILASW